MYSLYIFYIYIYTHILYYIYIYYYIYYIFNIYIYIYYIILYILYTYFFNTYYIYIYTYTVRVHPCVTAKLPVLGPWFWNPIWSNIAQLLATLFIVSLVGRVRCKHHLTWRCKIWNCRFITCGLHMILSQDEESSGNFSSFHAKPIS